MQESVLFDTLVQTTARKCDEHRGRADIAEGLCEPDNLSEEAAGSLLGRGSLEKQDRVRPRGTGRGRPLRARAKARAGRNLLASHRARSSG